MISEIDAVVFDMDGVLFDTERLYIAAWAHAAAELSLPDMEPVTLACIGLSAADTAAYFAAHRPDVAFEPFIEAARRHFHAEADVHMPVKEGARELLAALHAAGVPTALATSSRMTSVTHHLRVAALPNTFDAILTGDRVAHGKPAPDIYRLACETLHVLPARAVAVEDSFNGVRSAHAAGMITVMVPDIVLPTPEIAALAQQQFSTLTEMQRWLEV